MQQEQLNDCEIQLRQMVDAYAEDVNNGLVRFYELEEGEEGEHYEAYSVKYIIDQDGQFSDVMILLAGGRLFGSIPGQEKSKDFGGAINIQDIFMTLIISWIFGKRCIQQLDN